jgi:hypothetical protein
MSISLSSYLDILIELSISHGFMNFINMILSYLSKTCEMIASQAFVLQTYVYRILFEANIKIEKNLLNHTLINVQREYPTLNITINFNFSGKSLFHFSFEESIMNIMKTFLLIVNY